MKTVGPFVVVTWVSKYCPGGAQRAVRYLNRDQRVIPFSCAWVAWSKDSGVTWQPPVQLSSGLRDAIQDSSNGGYNATEKKGQLAITWQEDPHGLLLGEGDGPGDGASGATVSGGTDVWYTYANLDLSVAGTPDNDFRLRDAGPVRLTDNWQGGYGPSSSMEAETEVVDGTGALVPTTELETGAVGASRPNVAMVGSTALVAYEEAKGSGDQSTTGKFIRYHAFPFAAPPSTTVTIGQASHEVGTPGCVVSDPTRNARRVRVLAQSAADAGAGGIQLALFWREGVANKGGPADIVLRRGIGGVQPENLVPTVDAGCATSDSTAALALASQRAENVSSRTPTATGASLADDTEAQNLENALAHRGLLRGSDLWIGYSYASDLAGLAQNNYNFWLRRYAPGTGWDSPRNVTNIADTGINVREPRIFGTPKGNPAACPTGNPDDPSTTDRTLCQNTGIVYLAWGTQTNVADPQDLGVWITVSTDGGESFLPPVRYSSAMGTLFQDDEAAYESQVVTRPDGTRFYGVWNQASLAAAPPTTVAEYASGEMVTVPDPVVPPDGGVEPPPPDDGVQPTPPVRYGSGGCTIAAGEAPFDPALPLLLAFGLAGLGLRRLAARRA